MVIIRFLACNWGNNHWMTSLFARNERLLWRTRFSTTEMPSQFLTQYNIIKSWQFSVFFEVISPKHTRACSSLKRWFPDCMEHMHQKPIFSPLSCSLQAPERISGKNIFLKFFTQRVVFALCGPHVLWVATLKHVGNLWQTLMNTCLF